MGVLIIDDKVKLRVAEMIERARQHPVLLEQLKGGAINDDRHVITLADRKPGHERPPSQHLVLGTYRVAFSIEQQSIGMCRHLSISTMRAGSVPNMPVVDEVTALFGFVEGAPTRTWLEEFDPGHHAVNVLQLITPAGGHA
jgi:hypothetical protein